MLADENSEIRAMARRFAQKELAPHANAWSEAGSVPEAIVRRMGELGFLGLLIPQAYGGAGVGVLTFMLVMEEIAAGDGGLSTLMHVHAMGVARAIAAHGTDEQKQTWLPRMATGEAIGAFCLTEPGAGSDASAIQSRARAVDGGWRISGTKQFITNGARASLAIVIAVTDPQAGKRGLSAFIVPTNAPGFSVGRVEKKLGQASSDTAQLIFDDVFVAGNALFGSLDGALPMALSMLADGRASVAAQAVGMARAAYELALHFAGERVAFGKSLIEHQAIAFRLADMATSIEVARTFTHKVGALLDDGVDCLKEASMAKLFAGEMAEKVCSDAIHVHGGYGYLRDYTVERIYRDVRVCQIYEGTNDIQRMIIARGITT